MKNNKLIYKDSKQPIEKRTNDLLSRMTLEEKCVQLGSYWVFELLDNSKINYAKTDKLLKNGIGQITRIGGATTLHPKEAAEMANEIQKYLIEKTRLGIPAIVHEECCSGLMARGATLFPQAIGIASTWDPELTERMTNIIRDQMLAIGAHQGLAPVLDVTRDPRWGRTEETFGEDPYLVASMGCAFIRGLQQNKSKQVAIATGKHFVGYGNSEGGMNWSPCQIPERQLLEIFLFPFEAAVKEAGLSSIMNSYCELDGLPCCASKKLFQRILKKSWNFSGIVVSDYYAINMLNEYHKIAKTKQEAANLALLAGIDVELPTTDCYGENIKKALDDGIINIAYLNKIVERVLRLKFTLGIFEHPFVDSNKTPLVFETGEQRKLSYNLATESIVLLKNNGILPLSSINTLAVIGPNADNWRNMIGDYAYPCHIEALIEMKKINNPFNMPIPDNIGDISDALNVKTVLEGIKKQITSKTDILYAKGCEINSDSKDGFAEAIEITKKADVAIIVVGDKSGPLTDCTTGEARDMSDLKLPGVQEDLIRVITDIGKPVVVVLISGRPYILNWEHDHVHAILASWLPGEEGGTAVADVLFGKNNPGGKLPISFPRSAGQIPVYYAHKPSGGRSHWLTNYVNDSAAPLYPFGYGLSYTTFEFKNLKIDKETITQSGNVNIELDIKNTGDMEGDEVVQLYVSYKPLNCSITRPVKELKGFKRVHLLPGELKHLTFTLYAQQLAFYQEDLSYAINPGEVELLIGSSSENIFLNGKFKITGKIPKVIQKKIFFSDVSVSK